MADAYSPEADAGGCGTWLVSAQTVDVTPFSTEALRGAYDAVAADYATAFEDDLARLPIDREVMDAAFAAPGGDGWVVEAGCGSTLAASHLSDRAPRVLGVDLSAAMLTSPAPGTGGSVERKETFVGCHSGTVVARW